MPADVTATTINQLADLLTYNARTGALLWRADKRPATRESNGRLFIYAIRRPFYAERVAWLLAKGHWPSRITFMNGDKTDLRMCNLRILSSAELRDLRRQFQEEASRVAARKRSSLPHRVIECRETGLFYARVIVRGEIKVSPKVRTPEEARVLRDAMLTREGNDASKRL